MDTERFEQETDAGRDGLRTVRPAPPAPRKRRSRGATTEAVVVTPVSLVDAWENAYRTYGLASETVARSGDRDPQAAYRMATASAAVALAWRRIVGGNHLPWWILAAVESAAQAFEAQSRDWETRHDRGDQPPLAGGGS